MQVVVALVVEAITGVGVLGQKELEMLWLVYCGQASSLHRQQKVYVTLGRCLRLCISP